MSVVHTRSLLAHSNEQFSKDTEMYFSDLVNLWEMYKQKHGEEAYRYLSELLREAKELHKKHVEKKPTRVGDHEQSWRSFKGKNFEKLIEHIIKDEVKALGLAIVNGNKLDRSVAENLPPSLSIVKRNLLIDYGEFGAHFPDLDIVIYDPKICRVIAAISGKVTLRERIAQTGYWKIKLSKDE